MAEREAVFQRCRRDTSLLYTLYIINANTLLTSSCSCNTISIYRRFSWHFLLSNSRFSFHPSTSAVFYFVLITHNHHHHDHLRQSDFFCRFDIRLPAARTIFTIAACETKTSTFQLHRSIGNNPRRCPKDTIVHFRARVPIHCPKSSGICIVQVGSIFHLVAESKQESTAPSSPPSICLLQSVLPARKRL